MIFSEKFMEKLGPPWFRFSFVEVVHVELEWKKAYLADKGGYVWMLEVMRKQCLSKAGFILDYKRRALLIPRYDAPIVLLLQHIPCLFYEIRNWVFSHASKIYNRITAKGRISMPCTIINIMPAPKNVFMIKYMSSPLQLPSLNDPPLITNF